MSFERFNTAICKHFIVHLFLLNSNYFHVTVTKTLTKKQNLYGMTGKTLLSSTAITLLTARQKIVDCKKIVAKININWRAWPIPQSCIF